MRNRHVVRSGLRNLVLGAALLALAPTAGPLAAAAPATPEAGTRVAAPALRPVAYSVSDYYERDLLARVNYERTRRGIRALRPGYCPDVKAERWASYLASSGAFRHQSMSSVLTSCRSRRAAENIARGNVSAAAVVRMWMASPSHRANILDRRLTHVGTGAVRDRYGRWTAVQVFTAY